MLPFVGVDGEGGDETIFPGFDSHRYTMLRMGDHWARPDAADDGHLLRWMLYQNRQQINVSFFFDYDVTMMLRGLPETDLRVLLSDQSILFDGLEIAYRPRKEFSVKRYGDKRGVIVNDVGTFFQSKFVTALERWQIGTPEQRARIAETKEDRAHFTVLTDEIIEYNRQECVLLAELMTKFRRVCEVIGYMPQRWQGPGQLAKAMFKKHGIPLTKQLPEPPPGVWDMAQAAYYGGRFETSAVGPVKGPVEGWDIKSAYPHACTMLPCLLHGRWAPTKNLHVKYGLFRVEFHHRKRSVWYHLPVRMHDGSIRFPRTGNGWYWGHELLAAWAAGCEINVLNGWQYIQDCDDKPFDFMHRLFSIREAVGKTEAGHGLKLAMNSAYGITAQSIGTAPYANPVWAGFITSYVRARLAEVVTRNPYDVYMLATDGLFVKGGFDMQESDGLGGWEKTVHPDGMHIVQPGVYFAGDAHPKTRGVPMRAILAHEQELRNAWAGSSSDHYDIPLRQFIGLRLGIARGAPETLGQWFPIDRRISYDWQTKRRPDVLRRGLEAMRTEPYNGDDRLWTVPYERLIGGNLARNLDRLQLMDQPDWAQNLVEVM